jgi:hypothetical protein
MSALVLMGLLLMGAKPSKPVSLPMPPPPPSPPQPNGSEGYCLVAPSNRGACASNPGNYQHWHFHGYVEYQGSCFACFDEESNTCEDKLIKARSMRFLGADDCQGRQESSDTTPRLGKI